jgi:hypothetical protein
MKIWRIIVAAGLIALISTAMAQNPVDGVIGSIQGQISTAPQKLQEKAIQHATEGNLTTEHIIQDLNATKRSLTEQAKSKLNEKVNTNLDLTPEQLQQKATEELKKQVGQKAQQQPGFGAVLAIFGTLAAGWFIKRRG